MGRDLMLATWSHQQQYKEQVELRLEVGIVIAVRSIIDLHDEMH